MIRRQTVRIAVADADLSKFSRSTVWRARKRGYVTDHYHERKYYLGTAAHDKVDICLKSATQAAALAFSRHGREACARGLDCDDLIQESSMKLLSKADKPEIEIPAWRFRVAYREAIRAIWAAPSHTPLLENTNESAIEDHNPSLAVHPDHPVELGRLTEMARRTLKLTKSQMARRLGVSPGTLGDWEHGRRNPKQYIYYALKALVVNLKPMDLTKFLAINRMTINTLAAELQLDRHSVEAWSHLGDGGKKHRVDCIPNYAQLALAGLSHDLEDLKEK